MKFDLADLDFINAHRFFNAAIAPRPICLVSTVGENGVFNVAPFANYGRLSTKPSIVYIGVGAKRRARQRKDTIINIDFTKDFVINTVDEALVEPMNQAAANYPSDIDEFKEVGLTAVKSDLVKAPRVAESPISMECKLNQVLKFGEYPDSIEVVLEEVLLVHVRDDLWINGAINISKYKTLGRIGGDLYCRITDTFEMKTPNL
ncbi:flavin reductase family protein [Chloroflexota bacterium]